MIDRIERPDSEGRPVTQLIVRPNLSMSWQANLLLAGSIAFICMGIAIIYAFYGLWMVLPFAGAEVLFVTWCLYLTVRKLSVQEVITVNDDEIKVEWGTETPEKTISLPRHWSKLDYQTSDNPFEVGSLCVQAYGKRYSLGKGLGKDEKRCLYTQLKSLI